VFVVVAALGAGGYWYFTQNSASATSAAWQGVSRDDADALRAFISGDPGEYRDEAEQALADLEDRTYASAQRSDTIDAFEAFLNDFPDSEHATRARGRIAELRTMTPATTTEALPELPTIPETDPDLLPPGATTPEPDTSGGPTPITPPAEDTQTPPEAPTN
jgi:hypothetical protein